MGQHSSSMEGEQDGGTEAKPGRIRKHRRSMSLTTPVQLALEDWQAQLGFQVTHDSANATGMRAKRYATSTLADALWKSGQL